MNAPERSLDPWLQEALLAAVQAQRLLIEGRHASVDLAVVAFTPEPVYANVLFSREHPLGLVAEISADAGPVGNIHYLADQQDADGNSPAWQANADWQALEWTTLAGHPGQPRVVQPYPASLIKLMVLVGIGRGVDLGRIAWDEVWQQRAIADWATDMTVISCNDATNALVARLHAAGLADLDAFFERHGLSTLRFADTQASGGWRNADGAGVGHLQMTAWDTVRLLWLLDDAAPLAPWTHEPPLLSAASRQRVREILDAQQLNLLFAPEAGIRFAHKTGTTENYASDAGIVQMEGVHYLVALLSNVGSRHSQHADLHQLGAAIHAIPELAP